jgi:predicted YcjX-like family ATPase
MTEETETERLSRECRAMFDELSAKGAIDGTYEEWLKDATEKALKKLDPSRIILPAGTA